MMLDLFQASAVAKKSSDKIDCLFAAAQSVAGMLMGKVAVSPKALQEIMTRVFGGSDASGAWQWKDAYEVLEIAQIKFMQKYADTLRSMKPEMVLTLLNNLQNLCPTHTKRSEESIAMQQFSTPATIGYIVALAARMNSGDTLLEPSAGTGMLAVMGSIYGSKLVLNELAEDRGKILARLFPKAILSAHNAEYLADRLDESLKPSVVVMNPPFSSSPNAASNRSGVTMQHIMAALQLLPAGGRLVTITGEGFSPFSAKYRPALVNLQQQANIRFSCGIDGKLYAKQGTTIATRLTVIDKIPADNPENFANYHESIDSVSGLLELVQKYVSARGNEPQPIIPVVSSIIPPTRPADTARVAMELEYLTREWLGGETVIGEGLYEAYEPQTVTIAGAMPHPSALVQSAAMASIASPKPTYRPHIYPDILNKGILSSPQFESLIYAGEAHGQMLKGWFAVNKETGIVTRTSEDDADAVQFRKGWYLGDGPGCGKGRQVAVILLDNWLKGRKKGIWVSKNDKLLEDARRDWVALGGKEAQIIPQWQFKLGTGITLSEGIIFTTYSTLKMQGKQDKKSRLAQVEERVQLIRPLNSSKMSKTAFADSGWKLTHEVRYLITGILLPVWSKLPAENVQVCRLQTDDGQKLLGRVVENHKIAAVLERFELTASIAELSPQEILQVVSSTRTAYPLKNGLEIKNVMIMGQNRIEIIGFREAQKDILKSLGCLTEMIQWKLRLFVPANDNAHLIIEQLLQVA